MDLKDFREKTGQGIEAFIINHLIRIGKYEWVKTPLACQSGSFKNVKNEFSKFESNVFLSINNIIYGRFTIRPTYRNNIGKMLSLLKDKFKLYILSGDNDAEKSKLEELTNKK